jgi:hypothetical protein
MFEELASPKINNEAKFGRIKITTDPNNCDTGTTDLLYCHWDDSMNGQANCPGKQYQPYPNAGAARFQETGKCYFRDGNGPVAAANNADTTASYDWFRATTLNTFLGEIGYQFANKEFFPFLTALRDSGCFLDAKDGTTGAPVAKSTKAGPRNTEKLLSVKISCAQAFGTVRGKNRAICDPYRPGGVTAEHLGGAYAVMKTLQDFLDANPNAGADGAPTVDPAVRQNLDRMLQQVELSADAVIKTTDAFNERIDEEFGSKRPFFQTATGRGLLIGTGVGAIAGIGYYFAEGASTFCNVGGLDQTKMGKYFSIPSFREYIARYGFIK